MNFACNIFIYNYQRIWLIDAINLQECDVNCKKKKEIQKLIQPGKDIAGKLDS
jgi:hypothetical protein